MVSRMIPLAALLGCAPDPVEVDLVDVGSWTAATSTDPWADHATPGVDCRPGGVGREDLTLEVDTGECPYAFLAQPLLHGFDVGDRLEIVFWHADLAALEPSDGHIALLIDDAVLWERTVSIPSSPCAYADTIEAPLEAIAGQSIRLHLHNHGANTWNLHRIRRLAAGTATSWSPGCETR